MSDSSVIIRQLSKDREISLLTHDDSGMAIPISRLLENHLYWVMVYSRFVDPEALPHWRHEFYEIPSSKRKPSFFIHFIFRLIQKKEKSKLYKMGLGRLK